MIEWILKNLHTISENADCLTQDETQKLTLLLDVIDLIAT